MNFSLTVPPLEVYGEREIVHNCSEANVQLRTAYSRMTIATIHLGHLDLSIGLVNFYAGPDRGSG
jgi:hypothetical protein